MRALVWVGIGVFVAVTLGMAFFAPGGPATATLGGREIAAAFLGLFVLVLAVLGPDWRDWF